jgi:hypothetical protein
LFRSQPGSSLRFRGISDGPCPTHCTDNIVAVWRSGICGNSPGRKHIFLAFRLPFFGIQPETASNASDSSGVQGEAKKIPSTTSEWIEASYHVVPVEGQPSGESLRDVRRMGWDDYVLVPRPMAATGSPATWFCRDLQCLTAQDTSSSFIVASNSPSIAPLPAQTFHV